ncbi:MAG: efflux RND transporter periplasmic adaptor subunit [Bacteroidia bacterium]|nr:efflux RND transporter periplasmic adaptor subunit [Bacteroidia bacterium]MDW8236383.1 efflux RND transporter periplasmic adaptor subunit [Bacteroidia bacterium]
MKNWIYKPLTILLLIAASSGNWHCGSKELSVEVDTVRRRTLLPFITETATIRPAVEVPISPDVSGEIIAIYVKEGDTVKQGQLLFSIRPDNYRTMLVQMQAALEEAKAQYASAKASVAQQQSAFLQESLAYERARRLYDSKAISEAEWDAARLRYRIALAQRQSTESALQAAFHRIRSVEANLARTQIDLQRTSVYASMDGVITRLLVKVGQRVVGVGQMAGTESIRIADLSRFIMEAQVSENDVVRLHPGDSATIEVQAYPNLRLKGTVQQIGYSSGKATPSEAASSLAGEQANTYLVKIAIDSRSYDAQQYPLRPEMSAVLRIFYAKRENVLTIPIQAVVVRQNEEYVYMVEKGLVRAKKVRSGLSDDKYIEITEGLQENEVVVVGPYETLQNQLQDSTRVKPIPTTSL